MQPVSHSTTISGKLNKFLQSVIYICLVLNAYIWRVVFTGIYIFNYSLFKIVALDEKINIPQLLFTHFLSWTQFTTQSERL